MDCENVRISPELRVDHEETVNKLVQSLVCLTQRDQQLAHKIAQHQLSRAHAKLDEVRPSSCLAYVHMNSEDPSLNKTNQRWQDLHKTDSRYCMPSRVKKGHNFSSLQVHAITD